MDVNLNGFELLNQIMIYKLTKNSKMLKTKLSMMNDLNKSKNSLIKILS